MSSGNTDILYFVRLFSGLEQSVQVGHWRPTGVPTISKIVIGLDSTFDCKFVFCAKAKDTGGYSRGDFSRSRRLFFPEFRNPVFLCGSYERQLRFLPRKLRIVFRECVHILALLVFICLNRPKVVYFDHANILAGSIASALLGRRMKFIFRVMGVYPSMNSVLVGNSFRSLIFRWCYKREFDLVIGTQDGSGIDQWSELALSEHSRRKILINGMDSIMSPKARLEEFFTEFLEFKTVVFVGKLERYKGIYDFVEGCIRFLNSVENTTEFRVVIIGVGSETEGIKNIVSSAGLTQYFCFLSDLDHADLLAILNASWVYVSCNKLGIMSNANLDAIFAANLMLAIEPPGHRYQSLEAELISDNVIYVDPARPSQSISEELEHLRDVSVYDHNSRKFKSLASRLIISWDERVEMELDMIRELT